MKVLIKFKEDSPYYLSGEKERIVNNITEIHYCYESPLEPATAFESDIDCTGFTINNKYLKEFEAKLE